MIPWLIVNEGYQGNETLLALARFQDPEYLTKLFFQHSLLKEGRVSSVAMTKCTGDHSSYIGELKLQYTEEVSILPELLVLKLSTVDNGVFEALFHQVADSAKATFTAPVLASGFDNEVSTCFTLMPDYRATHSLLLEAEETFSTARLGCSSARQAITCLAQFHNSMMDNLPVGKDLGHGRYRNHALPLLESIPICYRLVDKFEEQGYSQKLASQLRSLLPEAVHYWNSQVRPRLKEEKNVTVVHGDCFWHHFWVPKAKSGSMILFDFDLATVHNPVWDLVTLLSTRRPEGLSTTEAIKCYSQHSRIDSPLKNLEEEFAWFCLCQIYHVLADWEYGCREVIWSQRLHNLFAEIPEKFRQ